MSWLQGTLPIRQEPCGETALSMPKLMNQPESPDWLALDGGLSIIRLFGHGLLGSVPLTPCFAREILGQERQF